MNRTVKSAFVGLASLFAVTAASAQETGKSYTALVTSSNGSDGGVSSMIVQGIAGFENCKKIAELTKSARFTSVVCLNSRGEVAGGKTCRADTLSSISCTPD
jgi:hypothetical protein